MTEIYLHVLTDGVEPWLVNVFRRKQPSCGPLFESAERAVRACTESIWLGSMTLRARSEISNGLSEMIWGFKSDYESVPGQHDAHVQTHYDKLKHAKQLERHERESAKGKGRRAPPPGPAVPRWNREPTFDEALQEEIGWDFITLTKAKSRILLTAYLKRGGAVTPDALEAFLNLHIGRQVFLVEWT